MDDRSRRPERRSAVGVTETLISRLVQSQDLLQTWEDNSWRIERQERDVKEEGDTVDIDDQLNNPSLF